MGSFFEDIVGLTAMYWGKSGYLVPFLISIAAALFWIRNKAAKRMFAIYSVVLLVIIYNPLFFKLSAMWLSGSIITCKNYIEEGSPNYVRVYYALPVTFAIGFAVVEGIAGQKDKRKKLLLAVVCITGYMMTAQNVYNGDNYTKAENWHKISADTITVCEMMKQTAQPGENIKALVSNDLIVFIRQYEAAITMPYGRESLAQELPRAFSDGTIAQEELYAWLDGLACNYVVCNWHSELVAMLEQRGYTIAGQTNDHVVLKMHRE